MENLLDRISIDPGIRFGKPCIRGSRIAVGDILELLGAGETRARIIAEYELQDEDISAAIEYAVQAISPKNVAAE
jgi:uncharacterized protein (DUF433 family)